MIVNNTNNNIYNNNNNSSNGDASDNDIRALQQARTDTLKRITVRTAYDPWELLDVLTLALEPDKINKLSDPFGDSKLPPYSKKPGVPNYDLVIVDGLHFLFLPYYGIHPFDSRSVSVIGGTSGVGTGVGTGTGLRSVGVLGDVTDRHRSKYRCILYTCLHYSPHVISYPHDNMQTLPKIHSILFHSHLLIQLTCFHI